ncbi:nuclear transport factor 2 family protein [Tsukamurella paurometabola]|uniref:SnoaL-like domain-containing protein n=1 Tax=Tsukamurella paurometabola TaxID=2061 RepID=A0A3P8KET7_TSUPA|nr:nuclear transport factor 2 family protein [Tsukamurella paurometabola]UEA81391.1 nuclear transport factor 2 family protein [Tsukamurella paurometabola]VDR38378.1 Uncharacterised protein [Tsukamurella paurometabola]
MDHAEIEDYLSRYAATLSRFDAEGGAALWAEPGMIVDDRFSGVLEDRASMARGLERSYPLYRALGLASVRHELLDVTPLTGAVVLLHVRWRFLDDDGAELTDSTAYYIVRRDEDGPHACVCVQVDDAAKLQELAAARGIDLADFLPDAPPA